MLVEVREREKERERESTSESERELDIVVCRKKPSNTIEKDLDLSTNVAYKEVRAKERSRAMYYKNVVIHSVDRRCGQNKIHQVH